MSEPLRAPIPTAALVNQSLRLAFRHPRLWAFGLLLGAIEFAQNKLLQGSAEPLGSLLVSLCTGMLLIGLSRECLTVWRGERPSTGDAFATVRRNRAAIALFGAVTFGVSRVGAWALLCLDPAHPDKWRYGIAALVPIVVVSFVSYMCLPVLARETAGPTETVRRSLAILGQVWWSRVHGLVNIGVTMAMPLVLAGIVFVLICVVAPEVASVRHVPGLLSVPLTLWCAVGVSADQFFDTALYLHATESPPSATT